MPDKSGRKEVLRPGPVWLIYVNYNPPGFSYLKYQIYTLNASF